MSEPDRVLVEILVAAPIETVWHALREPAEFVRWFGWEYAGMADEIDFIFGNAKASDADHTLRVTGMPDRYALEPLDATHTIVRVIRSAPATDPSWTGIYDDVLEGWTTFTHHLRFTPERHAGADRRTLYLNGRAKAAGTPLPADALGLASLAIVPVGERYAVTTAMGEKLEGRVWLRTTYQVGLTVDGYGDGLIIVTARTTTDKSPCGGGTVLISAYGLESAAMVQLRARWTEWWSTRYEVIEIQPAA